MMDDRTDHWDRRYHGTDADQLSWFEDDPSLSMALITATVSNRAGVIDIGGGASRLPDALLEQGFQDVTVLDLSAKALGLSRARIGAGADTVHWIAADITTWCPDRTYDLWHDRAVFHFLATEGDQRAYVTAMATALVPGGTAIVMTFANDGPEKCSGLPVQRYSSKGLQAAVTALAPGAFDVIDQGRFVHPTPTGAEQKFQYCQFRRRQA